MANKKILPEDDELADAFAELLDLALIPDSLEDAESIVRNANINIDTLNKRSMTVLRDVLADFPDDWRNVATDQEESISTKLEKRSLKLHLNETEIKERIQGLISRIVAHNQSSTPMPGLAWRNLDRQSKEDLARLLRKFELMADELGIEIKED
jgi:hypothetical protein